jgi:cytochrome c-type biogenesis protein CcmH/NrfG
MRVDLLVVQQLAEEVVASGVAKRLKGDLDGAIANFEKALELTPQAWPRRAAVQEHLEKTRAMKKDN